MPGQETGPSTRNKQESRGRHERRDLAPDYLGPWLSGLTWEHRRGACPLFYFWPAWQAGRQAGGLAVGLAGGWAGCEEVHWTKV